MRKVCKCFPFPLDTHPKSQNSPTLSPFENFFTMDVALGGLRENSICTFAVCSARYKTRPGLVYHYGHSHSTSSGDLAKELSPSPADVESRSTADAAVSDQSGWSLKISSIFSLTPEPALHFPHVLTQILQPSIHVICRDCYGNKESIS